MIISNFKVDDIIVIKLTNAYIIGKLKKVDAQIEIRDGTSRFDAIGLKYPCIIDQESLPTYYEIPAFDYIKDVLTIPMNQIIAIFKPESGVAEHFSYVFSSIEEGFWIPKKM